MTNSNRPQREVNKPKRFIDEVEGSISKAGAKQVGKKRAGHVRAEDVVEDKTSTATSKQHLEKRARHLHVEDEEVTEKELQRARSRRVPTEFDPKFDHRRLQTKL